MSMCLYCNENNSLRKKSNVTSVQNPYQRKSKRMQLKSRNHAELLEYSSVFVTLNTSSILLRKSLREILPVYFLLKLY